MNALKRSNDRKVTNKVSQNGKKSLIKNTFGLPSGKIFSCPGQTSICESVCYAGKLEKIYKGVSSVLLHNWNLLQSCSTEDEIVELLDSMIQDFRQDCIKYNAKPYFRIHWDGDFYDMRYTRAWNRVIRMNASVHFWVYTRSWFAIPELVNIPNLSLYFSTDSENFKMAVSLKNIYGVKLAYLADNFHKGESEFHMIQDKRPTRCPENNGRIPLISQNGSACGLCGACIYNRNDILFSASKK